MMKKVSFFLSLFSIVFFLGGCKDASWEKHLIQEEIVIQGLAGEYNFLFLTDTHVITSTGQESEEEYEGVRERKEQFVNESGVYSVDQFREWIAYANEQNVDALLLGGDVIDSPGAGNLEFLEQNLDKLQVPYLYTPGNHDWNITEEYMTYKAYQEFLPRLKPFMNDDTTIQKIDLGELRMIAVNNSSNQFSEQAVQRYEEYLQTEQRVIVLIHVPIITQSVLSNAREVWSSPVVLGAGNYGGIYPDEFSQKFMDLTTAADSPVCLVLAGHVHFYDKDYIEGPKKVLQVVGPAGYEGKAIHLKIKGTQ